RRQLRGQIIAFELANRVSRAMGDDWHRMADAMHQDGVALVGLRTFLELLERHAADFAGGGEGRGVRHAPRRAWGTGCRVLAHHALPQSDPFGAEDLRERCDAVLFEATAANSRLIGVPEARSVVCVRRITELVAFHAVANGFDRRLKVGGLLLIHPARIAYH